MMYSADVDRIHNQIFPQMDDKMVQELQEIEGESEALSESGITEGFDPFAYGDVEEDSEEGSANTTKDK